MDKNQIESIDHLNVILFQMRKSEETAKAEYDNFILRTGLGPANLTGLNLYVEPNWDANRLAEYDAFIIGGISDDPSHSLELTMDYYPFLNTFRDILSKALETKTPGLLSCGGFMLGSVLLGGEIALDPIRKEMDIVQLNLTNDGMKDPLFESMPCQFHIMSGHNKSTVTLPDNATLLAGTDKCPIHVFRINDSLIYGFQGHPEITTEEIKARVGPYREKYFDSEEQYLKFLENKTDTSLANSLVIKFLSMVLNHKKVSQHL